MLRYFKHFAILEINITQILPFVRDAVRICYFNITISWKRNVFYQNRSAHVISFKLRSWKILTLKISLKRIFTSSSMIKYLYILAWKLLTIKAITVLRTLVKPVLSREFKFWKKVLSISLSYTPHAEMNMFLGVVKLLS